MSLLECATIVKGKNKDEEKESLLWKATRMYIYRHTFISVSEPVRKTETHNLYVVYGQEEYSIIKKNLKTASYAISSIILEVNSFPESPAFNHQVSLSEKHGSQGTNEHD